VTGVVLAGLATVDLVQRVEAIPEPGEKMRSTSVEMAAGGPAANAAVTVAALGGHATLLTGLGAHPLGQVAHGDLRRHHVRVMDLAAKHQGTPTVSAVTVRERDGERTVVSYNAADFDLSPPAELDSLVASAHVVLLDGHHPRLATATAVAARRHGVPVVLDAGSFKPILPKLLPLVEVCAASASFRMPGSPEARETEQALHDLGVPVVIRTHGAQPVTWSYRTPGGITTGAVEPERLTARDTLGAGDVWHGALAYEIARQADLAWSPDLLRHVIGRANLVAARRVRQLGSRAWLRGHEA
jgi:sugar/nucleoside kinase (ribokinase family)